MEKNERLAWRTKPRTYCRCFSSCTKRNCNGRPFQLQIIKNFQSLRSCFLIFPSRQFWEQAVSFSGAFPAAQSAVAMGDPSNWQILIENFSRAWKVVFWFSPPDTFESRQWAFQVLFQLPKAQWQWETLPTGKFWKKTFQSLKTPLGAGSELFRCFSSCPKRSCNGRPFQLANFNRKLFRAWKVVFWFPLQTPLRAGSELFRCFSSCPKRSGNGRPFQLANFERKLFRAWKVVFWFSPPDTFGSRQWAFQVLFQLPKAQWQWETLPTGKLKKNFSGPEKLFFDFPLQTPLRAGSELFRCFSSCPKRSCNGRPFQLANYKKLFRAWKVVFLIFPSRHLWEQAVSFSGAFPAAQSAVAMGDPSNWQILKENFSGPEKLFFDFPLQTPFRAGSELFRCFSSCPKRSCNGRPFQLANYKKLFRAWKVVFWFSLPENFQGSGKLCHRPTPRHMFEPAWSHKNRVNSQSWWNEAR